RQVDRQEPDARLHRRGRLDAAVLRRGDGALQAQEPWDLQWPSCVARRHRRGRERAAAILHTAVRGVRLLSCALRGVAPRATGDPGSPVRRPLLRPLYLRLARGTDRLLSPARRQLVGAVPDLPGRGGRRGVLVLAPRRETGSWPQATRHSPGEA